MHDSEVPLISSIMSQYEVNTIGSPTTGPSISRFTTRHFTQMANYSLTCPLRIIGHIDLDAFYAQCEMVRLNLPLDKPLAVRQWQGLIAINYPARAFGIKRMTTIHEARKLCPEISFQHVATWREGETTWAYRPDAADRVTSDKVSLDPYRIQSRKIMAIITETLLAPPLQKVEKASIDEVFMDLSAHVQSEMLRRYPILKETLDLAAGEEHALPLPGEITMNWSDDELIPLLENSKYEPLDWDDVAMYIASGIVRNVRAAIFNKLRYTCSGGVSVNKLVSKLGSSHKKPNAQTVIRARAVPIFLNKMKFTKFRNLGGKLGEKVASEFGTESVSEILNVSLEQLCARLGPDTGTWIYNTVRGIDTSEVTSRTAIKSMLSAKQFSTAITKPEQATSWFRIFSADIYNRLVDVGVLDNKRRPKTLTLHYRGKKESKGRATPIPKASKITIDMLVECCKTAWAGLNSEGYGLPCQHLSVNVSGFEEGVSGNMGIGIFLVKRSRPISMSAEEKDRTREQEAKQTEREHEAKRQRLNTPASGSIVSFFSKAKGLPQKSHSSTPEAAPSAVNSHNHAHDSSADIIRFFGPCQAEGRLRDPATDPRSADRSDAGGANSLCRDWSARSADQVKPTHDDPGQVHLGDEDEWEEWPEAYATGDDDIWHEPDDQQDHRDTALDSVSSGAHNQDGPDDTKAGQLVSRESFFFCAKCPEIPFGSTTELQSHDDWHLAVELQESEREHQRQQEGRERERERARGGAGNGNSRKGKGKRGGRMAEAGQQKLRFG